MKSGKRIRSSLLGLVLGAIAAAPLAAQEPVGSLFDALHAPASPVVRGGSNCPVGATVIYDTTHASNQGAEITAAANGAATCMGDKVVTIDHTLPVCEISVDVFTLASTTPFDLTLEIYTDCSTNGTANSPCGNGTGTLIPSSTTTVTGITPPALGTIFSVAFPVNNASLATETDNTITVKINASRSDVFWRLGETPSVGAQPEGAGTSFVERCGSTAANNGCSRNFGITNNFAMTIRGAPAVNADLSITKTDGVASVNAGGSTTYTITASNAGPDAATGATVADTFPAACTSVSWTCTGAGGGTCTANGSGNINDSVNLPSGGSVTYTATCAVSSGASGSLINTATVTAPAGTTDPTPGNNSATDTDTINSIVAPVFAYTPAAGSAVNFTGGTLVGSTGSASIDVTIGTPGLGTGASATTTTTCTAPTAPFAGFGQTVTAEGAAASTTGGPLSGTCTLGAAQVVQTLTCTENQGGTPVTRTFDLTCPAGTAAVLTSTPVSGSTVTTPDQILGTAATTTTISFQNPGLVPATVTCVAPAAPFTVNPLTINVPAGGSASTTVSFSSPTAGTFSDTLNCSAGAQQFVFALAGTASAPSVPVPATTDFTRLLLVLSALLMGVITLGLRTHRG